MESVLTCANVSNTIGSSAILDSLIEAPLEPPAELQSAYEAQLLNHIIASMLDNVDEYRRAIFGLEQLLDTLQCRLYNRVAALEKLQSHVQSLGAQPVTTRSALGAAFASLLASPQIVSRSHQEDLMLDVDRGERALKAMFKRSLADKRLSASGHQSVTETMEQLSVDRCRPAELWSSHGINVPRMIGPMHAKGFAPALTPTLPNGDN